MNRLGIHISLFQLFVISTTHFSSPALHFVFYVRWNPRHSHILGRERMKAEIIVTLRKSLNLAGPLYSPSCGGSGSEPDPARLCSGVGGRRGSGPGLLKTHWLEASLEMFHLRFP